MIKSDSTCNQEDQLHIASAAIERNQRRTLLVIILTFIVMIIEIAAGFWTGSMALLADGYHMASHVGALSVSYIVYRLTQSRTLQARLNFGTGKLLPLGGYTSAMALGLMAFWMIYESVTRFFNPENIHFKEALIVAALGLATNFISAVILGWRITPSKKAENKSDHHHDHLHSHDWDHGHGHAHDPNHESALAHVLADALTSVLAIIALVVGVLYGLNWLDPVIGIIGAFVIIKWAYNLSRKSAWELLDGSVPEIDAHEIQDKIRSEGFNLHDFHLWKVGPQNYICTVSMSGSAKTPRELIRSFFPAKVKLHLLIENKELELQ